MTEQERMERAYKAALASMPRLVGFGAPGAARWAHEMRKGYARRIEAGRRLERVESLVKEGGDW